MMRAGPGLRTSASFLLLSAAILPFAACSSNREARSAATVATATTEAPLAPVTEASTQPVAPAVPAEPVAETVPAPEPAPADENDTDPGALQPGELGPEEAAIVDAAVAAAEAEETPEPATLLHESLDKVEAAKGLWEMGDLDAAFASLDEAYALMARVQPAGEPVLAQEKENLRQLISRSVVEIYASRQTTVGNRNGSIPLVLNEDVQREISSFQGRERTFFLESYARSGLYRPMILARLAEAGLPEQLSWLPLVESGFKERAFSSARAAGLWQFISSTGYRYGLDRTDWVDERMDPEKSTVAAIGYLRDLHDLLGDWLTALAAYNCGEGNVLRQIGNQKEGYFDRFWDLYARLPRETRRYVPRFLATLAILEDPAKYGFDLPEPYLPPELETVEVARAAKLESFDQALSISSGSLARFNPELRRNATPKTPYALKVPKGQGVLLAASVAAIPEYTPPKVEVGTHRVRSGETLGLIAARYRTSVKSLMSLNNLRSANRLSVGQTLRVPTRGGSSEPAPRSARVAAPAPVETAKAIPSDGALVQHRVRSGESLWTIASRYGVSPEQIRSENNLKGNLIQIGQILQFHARRDRVGG